MPSQSTSRKKKISLSIMLTAMLLGGGAFAYFAVANVNTATPLQPDHTKNSTSENIETKSVTSIDNLQSLSAEPRPADWNIASSINNEVEFAYPPTWSMDGGRPSPGTGLVSDKSPIYIAYLGSDPETRNRACQLYIQPGSLEELMESTENKDTDDDGKVTDDPYRLWSDLIEKDTFIFNEHPAVRYKFANRVSTSPEKRYRISYIIGYQEKNYLFTCGISDTLTEETMEAMLKQIKIN